ncbi:MAG: acyl-CoA thioesterase, partial [Pseudomonadota bacterium]
MSARTLMTRGVAYPWYCDGMGHVATRYYTGWFDDASCHLLAMVGGDMVSLADDSLGWADV